MQRGICVKKCRRTHLISKASKFGPVVPVEILIIHLSKPRLIISYFQNEELKMGFTVEGILSPQDTMDSYIRTIQAFVPDVNDFRDARR